MYKPTTLGDLTILNKDILIYIFVHLLKEECIVKEELFKKTRLYIINKSFYYLLQRAVKQVLKEVSSVCNYSHYFYNGESVINSKLNFVKCSQICNLDICKKNVSDHFYNFDYFPYTMDKLKNNRNVKLNWKCQWIGIFLPVSFFHLHKLVYFYKKEGNWSLKELFIKIIEYYNETFTKEESKIIKELLKKEYDNLDYESQMACDSDEWFSSRYNCLKLKGCDIDSLHLNKRYELLIDIDLDLEEMICCLRFNSSFYRLDVLAN